MPRMRFLGLAWCSFAACCSLTAAAHARMAVRPAPAGGLRDGYCCPYGLGQWEGRPHRYVYGDYGSRDGGEVSPAVATPLPLVVEESRAAVGAQTPPSGFYDDVGDSNFDCPCFHKPATSPAAPHETASQGTGLQGTAQDGAEDRAPNHPICQGEDTCETEPFCEMPADEVSPLRSLEEALADWRHSAGLWIAEHVNAESDGLDETAAGELDWGAIASQMEGNHSPVSVDSPSDIPQRTDEGSRGASEEEDAEGTDGDWFRPRRGDRDTVPPVEPPKADGEDTSRAPGRLRDWCGEVWGAIRSAARNVSRRLEQLSEEVGAEPTTANDDEAVEVEAVEVVEPQTDAARPPLPDYFLPAFGSPWDGDL